MLQQYKSPLSVYFVWHPADEGKVKPIYNQCYSLLSRDVNRPFSRAMNLPLFMRTSITKSAPIPIEPLSEKTIVFIFLSLEMTADDYWVEYVRQCVELPEPTFIIPIALDQTALRLNDVFKFRNFIRSYEFELQYFIDYLFISISHEIYRYALNEKFTKMALGSDTAIKLFLSHAKDGRHGIALAQALKNFIDQSSMRNFFDASDIAPSYRFDEEIEGHIKESTLIAIHTDSYSSRYWCQREIICAKENDRPIIAVDCLEDFEDRRFPYSTNIPGFHIHLSGEPTKRDLLRILSGALLETIRFFYSKLILEQLKNAGWIGTNSMLLARPPELSDISRLLDQNTKNIYRDKMIVYPEPPVYLEEILLLKNLDIHVQTPLTIDLVQMIGKNIGISISDPPYEELILIGQSEQRLIQLSQDLARYLLSREAVLHYGGDLRENGFTEFLFQEALALQSRTSQNIHVKNHIAWPLYLNDSEQVKRWKANYRTVAKMVEYPPPEDTLPLIPSITQFLAPITVGNKYIWSRTLTEMRRSMINLCDVRICAGGKPTGYLGIMPGILEEILLTLELKRPLFLLGGFGGITASVCTLIETGNIPEQLTEKWQVENNEGYRDLLDRTLEDYKTYPLNYDSIVEGLLKADLNNGLSQEDNIRLFHTPFIEEALHLIFKGISCNQKAEEQYVLGYEVR